ncbi:hypothetical protein P171DRAFT_521784 [Karstenula rhodostoma CBS 690.94]|uniref:Uncharacterized protein n=1 Tax=Karstenula rhodostoma CBS 690.94 TaxID=1392251 RepID=A0A9P4UBS4_9PLEO|nr:hypothetical protein P171DRAFT_521784 [Karstenula rhodostoma CBS 690.94]
MSSLPPPITPNTSTSTLSLAAHLSIATQPTMSTTTPSPTLFTHLKSQITSIALALYGAPSPSAFDIVTYTTPLPPSTYILLDGRPRDTPLPRLLSGVALVTYTSPGACTKWICLARCEGVGEREAMEGLLGDLRAGMGGMIGALDGEGEVVHRRVPDVVDG